MKKERFMKMVIILLVLLNCGTLGYLWLNKNGENDKGPREGAMEYLTAQLKLSPEQQKQFETLRDEHRAGNKKIRVQNKQLHDNFFDLLKSGDSIAVEKTADSIAILHKQQEISTFYHFQKIRAICNEEQKKKFDSLIKETMKLMAPPPPGHLGPPPHERKHN